MSQENLSLQKLKEKTLLFNEYLDLDIIQETLKTLYAGVEGEYYAGDDAWEFLLDYCGVDLKAILTDIANEKTPELQSTSRKPKLK